MDKSTVCALIEFVGDNFKKTDEICLNVKDITPERLLSLLQSEEYGKCFEWHSYLQTTSLMAKVSSQGWIFLGEHIKREKNDKSTRIRANIALGLSATAILLTLLSLLLPALQIR